MQSGKTVRGAPPDEHCSGGTLARATRRAIAIVVPVVLALAFLWVSVRNLDWSAVRDTVVGSDISGLVAVAAIGTATLFLRSFRWRLLLTVSGNVGVTSVYWATAVGYALNSVLPARAGDAARVFMISSRGTMTAPYVVATLVTERTADLVMLVAVACVVVITSPADLGWLREGAIPVAIAAAVIVAVVALLPRYPALSANVAGLAPKSLDTRLRLEHSLTDGLRGLGTLHHRRRFLVFFSLTTAIWGLDALATIVAGAAMGIVIPPVAALLLLAALGLGTALPSTPGYVGIYQLAAVAALTPFGVTVSQAIAYILVVQALLIALMSFWGGLGFAAYRMSAHVDPRPAAHL